MKIPASFPPLSSATLLLFTFAFVVASPHRLFFAYKSNFCTNCVALSSHEKVLCTWPEHPLM